MLVASVLQGQLQLAFQKAFSNKQASPEQAAIQLAMDVANAVDAFVKTATVNPGQLVVGSGGGVPGPMSGATTTPGTIS